MRRLSQRCVRLQTSLRGASLLVTVAVAVAAPAAAELVVLSDGSVLKVSGYEIEGDAARLELPSGGRLTLSMARIEHIVDDEIVPEEEVVEAEPGFTLEFREEDPVPVTPYGELIHATARKHRVSSSLVAAMVRAESAFDAGAVSPKGARGLLQLMPATARRFGIDEERIFEPAYNLEAGVRYLRWLIDRYPGDLARILAAYNAGEATVDRYDGVPPYRETNDYIRRILGFLGLSPPTAG